MKIAMLTNNYRPFVGGVPISVERQAEELVKRGHEVTVFAPMYGENEEERQKVLDTDLHSPERVIRFAAQKRKMDNGMVYPSLCPIEIMQTFEQERFDCIHVHHPMFVGTCALWLGRKYDLPVIYTCHTRYEDYLHYIPLLRVNGRTGRMKQRAVSWIRERVIPSYMKWFANQCDLVLAPSAGMRDMMREYGMTSRCEVFPTGLDESSYQKDDQRVREIREQYGRGRKHLLVTVSRLEREKNYGFLLRGIAEMKRKMGDNFHVMILGDGSQKGELKAKASILGISDVVTFLGSVPNGQVKDYLGAADLFLFASKSETQGIVLAEAMAAGTPVTAVHAVGADDIIENGVNGFLTEESEEAWADQVIKALSGQQGQMREAALRTAGNYRASRLAIYEEMLYNQCICVKRRPAEAVEAGADIYAGTGRPGRGYL